jgi:hypothetical protein
MPDNLPLLYLDIDGVLLRRRHSGLFDGFELAPHCLDFLTWAIARFRCRWRSREASYVLDARYVDAVVADVRSIFGTAGVRLGLVLNKALGRAP